MSNDDDTFRELLMAEYQHVADSLLRNEEDGETRVTFFMTLAGAAGTALAFLLGDDADVGPGTVHPLIIVTLAIVAAMGYLTFVRVVTRNLASDDYKRRLGRIRGCFLSGPEDPRRQVLAFDPFKIETRPRPSWKSTGKGGWLETVVLVESIVFGGLIAMVVPTTDWWRDGIVAIVALFGTWVLLLWDAGRRYDARADRKP